MQTHKLKQITKAVFPVAGMGTRFLPATKANPKEMLPIVDKPLIQYAVEEAVAAGIKILIFVTGRNKRSIPDHFDKAYELENELEKRGKKELLDLVQNILPADVTPIYIRQTEALGLGHAVLCAEPVVGNDPFAVILADDLIDGHHEGALQQIINLYHQHHCSVLGLEKVGMDEISRYGVVKGKILRDSSCLTVEQIVEKPKREEAPSDLAVVGRYLLTPAIFPLLRTTMIGSGGEIQLTDAISSLMKKEQILGLELMGKRYDCGDKLGYLQATVEYAFKHPDLSDQFRSYLKQLIEQNLV